MILRPFLFLFPFIPVFLIGQDVNTSLEEKYIIESHLIEGNKNYILENYSKSYDHLKKALHLDQDNPTIHYKLAQVLVKTASYEKAKYHSNESLKLDSQNKFYYLEHARVLQLLGDFQEAILIYEDLISNIPETDQYLYDLAMMYQYNGKDKKALEVYQRAEDHYGLTESILLEKQKIYLKLGELNTLIEEWDKLIKNNPLETRYILNFCRILIANEKLDLAEIRIKQLKEKIENTPEADLMLSGIKRKQGKLDEAMALLNSPLRDPSVNIEQKIKLLSEINNQLGTEDEKDYFKNMIIDFANDFHSSYQVQAYAGDVLYRLSDKSSARRYYLNAISLKAGNYSIWNNVINIDYQLKDFSEMVNHSDNALGYFPNQAVLYLFNGIGNHILEDFNKAIDALTTGKKFTNNYKLLSDFDGQLGDVYNAIKEYDKSDAAYEGALMTDPNNEHVLNNYSYYLSLRKEKLSKALKMSKKLVDQYPENPTYLDTHGWVIYQSGKYNEALKYLEKAARLSDDGIIIEHLGDVLFRMGKIDEAVFQWKKAQAAKGASLLIEKKINDRDIYE